MAGRGGAGWSEVLPKFEGYIKQSWLHSILWSHKLQHNMTQVQTSCHVSIIPCIAVNLSCRLFCLMGVDFLADHANSCKDHKSNTTVRSVVYGFVVVAPRNIIVWPLAHLMRIGNRWNQLQVLSSGPRANSCWALGFGYNGMHWMGAQQQQTQYSAQTDQPCFSAPGFVKSVDASTELCGIRLRLLQLWPSTPWEPDIGDHQTVRTLTKQRGL